MTLVLLFCGLHLEGFDARQFLSTSLKKIETTKRKFLLVLTTKSVYPPTCTVPLNSVCPPFLSVNHLHSYLKSSPSLVLEISSPLNITPRFALMFFHINSFSHPIVTLSSILKYDVIVPSQENTQ